MTGRWVFLLSRVVMLAGIAAACTLTTDLDGLSGGAPGPSDAAGADARPGDSSALTDGATIDAPSPDGAVDAGVRPPSCAPDGGTGTDYACSSGGKDDCCESSLVPGGTFNRQNDAMYPAFVSSFRLDRFEVTVGRFAAFVDSGAGTRAQPPSEGDGAHPKIVGSGWSSAFNSFLAANTTELVARLDCNPATPALDMPISCVDWYTAFAFCIWDGGRLPTDLEFNYAAVGGSEQRYYPWSSPPSSTGIDATYATYDCPRLDGGSCASSGFSPVGTHSPLGDGRWGQSDLGGNVIEWQLDYRASYPATCTDCAMLTPSAPPDRADRDYGTASGASGVKTTALNSDPPTSVNFRIGLRCARNP